MTDALQNVVTPIPGTLTGPAPSVQPQEEDEDPVRCYEVRYLTPQAPQRVYTRETLDQVKQRLSSELGRKHQSGFLVSFEADELIPVAPELDENDQPVLGPDGTPVMVEIPFPAVMIRGDLVLDVVELPFADERFEEFLEPFLEAEEEEPAKPVSRNPKPVGNLADILKTPDMPTAPRAKKKPLAPK